MEERTYKEFLTTVYHAFADLLKTHLVFGQIEFFCFQTGLH